MNCRQCKHITVCRNTLRFPETQGCRSGRPSNHCPNCGSENIALIAANKKAAIGCRDCHYQLFFSSHVSTSVALHTVVNDWTNRTTFHKPEKREYVYE